MRLYHWKNSTASRSWAPGELIVMAPDLETAKTVIRERFEQWFRDGNCACPDDAGTLAARLADLETDLATNPIWFDTPAAIVVAGWEG